VRRRDYPSDLTDAEWKVLEPLIPKPKEGGRPRTTDMREVLNAVFSIDRTGWKFRALPHDFPLWSTVWSYFRTWRNDGTWERMHTTLREQGRVRMGREPTPSAAIIDSQKVEDQSKRGARGYDGGKKVKGRKRHLLVDTTGMILHVLVHEANIQDDHGGRHVLLPLKGRFPRLKHIWADSGYNKAGNALVGQGGAWLGGRDCPAPVEWSAVRVGAERRGDRLGKDPPEWLPRPQMEMDCGENLRLALQPFAAWPRTTKSFEASKKPGSPLP
jgi:putative transposase